ncbi:hypothetical protein M9434_001318 [Picochlorum sp. BPE23]|nr:hypothetical protein M9434_001318 [Picochlorum sp. BPE23]
MITTGDLVENLNHADTTLIETIDKTRAVMEHLASAQPDQQSIQTLCQEVVKDLESVGSAYGDVCEALRQSIPVQPQHPPR